MKKEKAISILKTTSIIFLIIGVIMVGIGFQKHKVYKNPNYDNYSYNNKNSVNAYVGGDAYNYIINGTYFTAYSILGTGALIIATITGVGALFMSVEKTDKVNVFEGNIGTIQDIESNLPKL